MLTGTHLVLIVFHGLVGFLWIGGRFVWDVFIQPLLEIKTDWGYRARLINKVNKYGMLRWFLTLRWLTFVSSAGLLWLGGKWDYWFVLAFLIVLFFPFWHIIPELGPRSKRERVVDLYLDMAGSLDATLDPNHARMKELEAAFSPWIRAGVVWSSTGFAVLVFTVILFHGPPKFW